MEHIHDHPHDHDHVHGGDGHTHDHDHGPHSHAGAGAAERFGGILMHAVDGRVGPEPIPTQTAVNNTNKTNLLI